MIKPFLTSAPENPKWDGGYGGGPISPCKLADEVFGEVVHGSWLCCYMLRRFGWPNVGSDDHKNLMTWAITTPVNGLYLSVTPYLGDSMNLHFGVLFACEVGRKIEYDAGRESYFRRQCRIVMGWWRTKGAQQAADGADETEEIRPVLATIEANVKELRGIAGLISQSKDS